MTLTLSTLRNLLPCALLFLAACAQLPPDQAHYPVGRGQIILPPGDWQDLGTTEEALPLLPQAEGRIPLQSRAVALRGPQKQLLAVLRVQTNRRRSIVWRKAWAIPVRFAKTITSTRR